MRAFPGSFTFIDLLNLDVRDIQDWYTEALMVLNESRLSNLSDMFAAVRCAGGGKGRGADIFK